MHSWCSLRSKSFSYLISKRMSGDSSGGCLRQRLSYSSFGSSPNFCSQRCKEPLFPNQLPQPCGQSRALAISAKPDRRQCSPTISTTLILFNIITLTAIKSFRRSTVENLTDSSSECMRIRTFPLFHLMLMVSRVWAFWITQSRTLAFPPFTQAIVRTTTRFLSCKPLTSHRKDPSMKWGSQILLSLLFFSATQLLNSSVDPMPSHLITKWLDFTLQPASWIPPT